MPSPIPDPLLSVVIPVYNEQATIVEIIDRVLAQPFRIEIVAVDDGSTDGSLEILRRLESERAEMRVFAQDKNCLLYTSPSPRDGTKSRMPSSA